MFTNSQQPKESVLPRWWWQKLPPNSVGPKVWILRILVPEPAGSWDSRFPKFRDFLLQHHAVRPWPYTVASNMENHLQSKLWSVSLSVCCLQASVDFLHRQLQLPFGYLATSTETTKQGPVCWDTFNRWNNCLEHLRDCTGANSKPCVTNCCPCGSSSWGSNLSLLFQFKARGLLWVEDGLESKPLPGSSGFWRCISLGHLHTFEVRIFWYLHLRWPCFGTTCTSKFHPWKYSQGIYIYNLNPSKSSFFGGRATWKSIACARASIGNYSLFLGFLLGLYSENFTSVTCGFLDTCKLHPSHTFAGSFLQNFVHQPEEGVQRVEAPMSTEGRKF